MAKDTKKDPIPDYDKVKRDSLDPKYSAVMDEQAFAPLPVRRSSDSHNQSPLPRSIDGVPVRKAEELGTFAGNAQDRAAGYIARPFNAKDTPSHADDDKFAGSPDRVAPGWVPPGRRQGIK
jgi:hypothetical protein